LKTKVFSRLFLFIYENPDRFGSPIRPIDNHTKNGDVNTFTQLKQYSMKQIIFSLFICSLFFHQRIFAQELKVEFLFGLEIDLKPPQVVGPVLKGTRLISPFKDGVVKSDKINGKVLECSGDWGLIIDSTTFKVDSRVAIQTDDGALIYITYTGYSYASAKIAALIGAGKGGDLSPSDYYFRTAVSFETSSPAYAWLNHTIGIGVGRFPAAGKVSFRIYTIK
jgi:Protein of unknown function (DUF3237)